MLNKADTRAKLIDPRFLNYGRTEDIIKRDISITPDKIVDENGNINEILEESGVI